MLSKHDGKLFLNGFIRLPYFDSITPSNTKKSTLCFKPP